MKFILLVASIAIIAIANNITTQEGHQTWFSKPAQAQTVEAVPVPSGSYHRGVTELQRQPCRPDFDRSHYKSEIISKREYVERMTVLGIPAEHRDILAAIGHAESGSQLSCHGDDYKPYYLQRASNGQTWLHSHGVFQIRLIKEHTGTGSCRDIQRISKSLDEQIKCAWEISQHGRSYSPWSVTHSNRGKPYLKWLGKEW
jgi:hypothetical protein